MSATYNNYHQPLSVTDSSGTSTFSYTNWGAPSMSVDPQNRASRVVYDAAGQVSAVQRADAPTGAPWQTLGSFTYDEMGRVQTATDTTVTPNLTMGYRYNNLDEIIEVTYPDGTKETTDYVCCGLPGVVTDRSGRKSYYDYDVLKRLTRVQDAQGNTLQMDYDKNGNLVRLVDAKGQLTKWAYDVMNRAVEKKYHDGTTEAYSYGQGLLKQSKGARGQIVSYAYDNNANLTGINYPNMPDVAMSYNNLDDVTQIVDGVGTHSFTYDNIGKLLSLDGPFANDEQTFGYDSLQRLSGQSVQRGASGGVQSQSYAYDALGRLSTLTSNGTQGVGAFTYNYEGLTSILTRLDLPNGTQTVQSYDALQRLTQVVNKKTGGADLNKFAYAYDNRDVRTGVQQKYGSDPLRQVNYSYDSVDQLVGEAATGGVAGSNYSNAYSYDAMGNRLKRENTQGTITSLTRSGVNELNQLTSVSTSVDGGPRVTGGMNYDAAGNLTEMGTANGGRTLYVYDDADRLFRIEKRDANDAPVSKSEFVYDYASRKAVSQEFTFTAGAWVQTSEKRRVFVGMDVVQERDESNQVKAQLVRDGNIEGILSRSTVQGASFFGYDGGGNVTLLTDVSGNEVGRYRYDAFGNTLEVAGLRAAENPYRFSTKELHGASGLYDFGFRFYSASLGRWINRDPIAESGGLNFYAMVENSPTNHVDSYGLHPDSRYLGAIANPRPPGSAGIALIVIGNIGMGNKNLDAAVRFQVEQRIARQADMWTRLGYTVKFHDNASTGTVLGGLRNKNVRVFMFEGHNNSPGATGNMTLATTSSDITIGDIIQAMSGRSKLDEAILNVCASNDPQMSSALVGNTGRFNAASGNFNALLGIGVAPYDYYWHVKTPITWDKKTGLPK